MGGHWIKKGILKNMMNILFKTYTGILIYCFCFVSNMDGQVVITPNYSGPSLLSANQGFDIRILNTSRDVVEGYLLVRVQDSHSGGSLQVRSDLLSLRPGTIVTKEQISWDGGLRTVDAANTPFFTEVVNGLYNFCYRFIALESGKNLGTNCRDLPINKLARPNLIYPLNGQILNNSFPILSWRPPMPLPSGNIQYHIKVVRMNRDQSPIDAINANYPLLDRYGIRSTSFPYPSAGMPLDEGEDYAWQVQAYSNQQPIGETEVWKFVIPEEAERIVPEEENESFRGTKESLDGAFYVFRNHIYLSYDNRNYDKVLNYSIREKANTKNVIDCPSIELVPGRNNIKIEVGGQLSKNKLYVLEINSGTKSHFLEFKKIANKQAN